MQTFIPWEDYNDSLDSLDTARQFKQLVECIQIADIIIEKRIDSVLTDSQVSVKLGAIGFRHHPAVLMWEPFPGGFADYMLATNHAVHKRGERRLSRNTEDKIAARVKALKKMGGVKPQWVGNQDVHQSHRRALCVKDWDYYSPQFPDVMDLPSMEEDPKSMLHYEYVWPVDVVSFLPKDYYLLQISNLFRHLNELRIRQGRALMLTLTPRATKRFDLVCPDPRVEKVLRWDELST